MESMAFKHINTKNNIHSFFFIVQMNSFYIPQYNKKLIEAISKSDR